MAVAADCSLNVGNPAAEFWVQNFGFHIPGFFGFCTRPNSKLGKYPMRVISIDAGITGALAVVSGKAGALAVEAVHDLPTLAEKTSTGKTRRRIDPVALHELVQSVGKVDRVICERMVAPPNVSGMAAFSMGATMATIGTVLALANLPLKLVSPVVWKRAIECPPDKEAARQYATKRFGHDKHWPRKKDHNRAESALIGLYAILGG